ncbi:hypothetical protein L7F22_044599 [Adiantum nelumboides]|nr:hypothetical protein [Adiantum nelumboides]
MPGYENGSKDGSQEEAHLVSGELKRWYIDIYDVQGNKLPRPHVLICNLEDKDCFEDVGQLWSVCMSVLDSNPDIQCLDIFVPGKLSYHLLPQAYATDCMVSNKEDTMFSRGWNIEADDAANFTYEVLQFSISEIQQWKPPKAGGKSKLTPNKPRKRVSTTLDTTEAEAGPSNLGLPNSKRLVKMAKKAKDSPSGGISQYANFFPLGLYREFEILVAKCFLAPEHIICRSMSEDKLEIILGWFTSNANNPASCAYLMPIDWVLEHKAIPKKKDRVKVEGIQNYDYWIIDGQHSISCAKILVTTNDLDEGLSFISTVKTSMGAYFAQKQSHMVACPDDIFETWCAIIDDVEKGKLEVKRPNPTHFRCLCGSEFDEVRSIQDMLKKGKIVLSKGVGEKSKTDMPEYVMQTKHDKVIQEALALEFSAANPSKKFQDWEEIATFYGMSENIYGMLQKKCDAWLKSKLQVDEYLLDIEYKIVRPMDPRAYLREKKTMLINKCINLYCTKVLMVIDAYSNGFVLRCALKERREVMGLVERIKEHEELHSELLSFATSDRQVKEWANIVEDLQTVAQDQQQAIESSTSETQLVLQNKTPPSKPFDPKDDESKKMDEDQRQIVKELEGVQDNKAKPCNDLRDYQQNISGHDGKGPHGATEHQLEPMLLGIEVHEDDESENEDEDQTNIVKGLEGVQVNKPNLYNNDNREYRQKLLINDTEGSHGATEHQLQPILLEAEVHEDASTLARQPSSSLQGTCH